MAKISLFFSLILSSLLGSAYIGLDTTNLNFDFRTGDSEPVYWLAVTNRGPQKARFNVSTDVGWINIYRETQPGVTSVEISQTGALAFVVEIHPRELTDGSHRGRVLIKAFNPLGYEEQLDSREVAVTLNKNLPAAVATYQPTASATQTAAPTPTGAVNVPVPSPTPIPSADGGATGQAPPATPKNQPAPVKGRQVSSPEVAPASKATPAGTAPRPQQSLTPLLAPQPEMSPPAPTRNTLRSLWLFLRDRLF